MTSLDANWKPAGRCKVYVAARIIAEIPAMRYYAVQEAEGFGQEYWLCVCAESIACSAAATDMFRERAMSLIDAQRKRFASAGELTTYEGRPALKLEAIPGQLLRTEMELGKRVRRRLSVQESVRAVSELLGFLADLHPKFVYGNISPDTLWRGETGVLRPLGFSLKSTDSLDPKNDVRGVARLLWELLTGSAPVSDAASLQQVRADVPRRLARVLEQALSGDADKRFADAASFRKALGHPKALASSASPADMTTFAWVAAGLAIILCIFGAAITYRSELERLMPWRLASERREAIRLSGVVQAMVARAKEEAQRLRSEADESGAEAARLLDRLEAAASGPEYDNVLPRYVDASLESNRKTDLQAAYAGKLSHRDLDVEVALAEATGLLAAEDYSSAVQRFRQLFSEFETRSKFAEEAREELRHGQQETVGRLEGQWGLDNCASPSTWHVVEGALEVKWPGKGVFNERILGADKRSVFTTAEMPENSTVKLYKYTFDGEALIAQELGRTSASMRMRRC